VVVLCKKSHLDGSVAAPSLRLTGEDTEEVDDPYSVISTFAPGSPFIHGSGGAESQGRRFVADTDGQKHRYFGKTTANFSMTFQDLRVLTM
jgi:hypothetical protein